MKGWQEEGRKHIKRGRDEGNSQGMGGGGSSKKAKGLASLAKHPSSSWADLTD